MIRSELLAIFYGLASAISWGAGDFSGGIATKRASVYTVIVVSQFVGFIGLTILALSLGEPLPNLSDMVYGAVAGISGVIGLTALYRGLSQTKMGLVAPVAAVVSTLVPIGVGAVLEGLPAVQQLIGFVVALLGVWLISRPTAGGSIVWSETTLPIVAGLGFGFFFVIIDQVTTGALLWPLASARLTSTCLLISWIVLSSQQSLATPVRLLPLMALAGVLDTGGNAFFLLATQTGRLDISSVLSSLYPVTTILLAWFVLKERLQSHQWVGAGLSLIAVLLIVLG